MARTIRYLSHPQVVIRPTQPVPEWSLSPDGLKRVAALASSNALRGTQTVVTSTEVKAQETAQPLATALDCTLVTWPDMHENDRSATGYLPAAEFEAVADQFFAHPTQSIRGWETAQAAQERIVSAVNACLRAYPEGDLLFVGHGGVGTLLYCHLAGRAVTRAFDQRAGGGCLLTFSDPMNGDVTHWMPLEEVISLHASHP